MLNTTTIDDTPIGPVSLVAGPIGLTRLSFGAAPGTRPSQESGSDVLAAATLQLAEYFAGRRRVFELPLELDGTPFQIAVWRALLEIPFGTTVSYGEIAQRIGRPRAVRAVGAANGKNPIAIIIPCHRVIGSDGKLTGYGGGLPTKSSLLKHEDRFML